MESVPSPSKLIAKERAQPSFDVVQLTHAYNGSAAITDRRRRLRALARQDAELAKLQKNLYFLPRVERYTRALGSLKRLLELKRQYGLSAEEFAVLRTEAVADAMPTDLHELAFVPFLRGQASDEQQARWLDDAENYRMIGAYAQTELGHGSNVRALETTATFDVVRDEFVLHTPTLTSLKWWPGNMAKTANTVLCMAQLLVSGKSYGVHAFLVPIRCRARHEPLPGVTIGDIGSKLGMNAIDNGYLRLDSVRIPRGNMLMRFASLTRDGVYSQPPHAKLAYGGMIFVRASIIANAGAMLARAATIATRYSAVRVQFNMRGDEAGPEQAVLDYAMQQYRVLPLVATVFALRFTGAWMSRMYETLCEQMGRGEFSLLGEVHAASSGLKSLTTMLAGDGIETLRKACGGHGFLTVSGLPDLFAGYVGVLTAEGENYLLTQQTARAMLAALQRAMQGKPVLGSSAYVQNWSAELAARCPAASVGALREGAVQLAAFRHRATRLTHALGLNLQRALADGMSAADAWLAAQVEAYRVSVAHSLVLVVDCFASEVARHAAAGNSGLAGVLGRLRDLFALFHIESQLGEFLEDGYLSGEQADWVRQGVRAAMAELRPDAVPIVDAFDFEDFQLHSALGRYDGDVYNALYQAVQEDPMNRWQASSAEPTPGYRQYLEPIIKSRL